MKDSRFLPILFAAVIAALTAGCSRNAGSSPSGALPVAKGELISVDLLDKPYPQYSPNSLGWSTVQKGTVEVYANFIIVTGPDGTSYLAPTNWYKDLRFRQAGAARSKAP
jgi:hypothetical protein